MKMKLQENQKISLARISQSTVLYYLHDSLTATSFFDTVSLRLDMTMEVSVVIPFEEWCPDDEEYAPREMGGGGGGGAGRP